VGLCSALSSDDSTTAVEALLHLMPTSGKGVAPMPGACCLRLYADWTSSCAAGHAHLRSCLKALEAVVKGLQERGCDVEHRCRTTRCSQCDCVWSGSCTLN
jgi:hypothetical protein